MQKYEETIISGTKTHKSGTVSEKARVGRPFALEASDETLRQLRGLSRIHATHDEMADFFCIAHSTFQAFLKRSPEALEEIARGRAEGCISLRRRQFALAEKNAAMAIFLGKNYLGQADRVELANKGEIAIYIDADDARL